MATHGEVPAIMEGITKVIPRVSAIDPMVDILVERDVVASIS